METGLLIYYNFILGILVWLLFILFVVLTIKFFMKNVFIVSILMSIILVIAENPNYLTLNYHILIRISVLNEDMSKALNYVNELIKVKPESTSYAIRANIHKNIGQIELYESDKNRAINLCRNNAKCVKAAQIFAEGYVEGTILKEKKRRNMYGLE